MITLGNKVRDIVTGQTGIVTSRVEYINGCTQYCMTPPAVDNKREDGVYVDEAQLEVIGDGVAVKRSTTGGPQRDCPSARYAG